MAGAASIALVAILAASSWTASARTGQSPVVFGSKNSSCPSLNLPTPICHFYIVFLENSGLGYVMGHAPFQAHLAQKYALAEEYYSVIHYSFPNYLAATSGHNTNLIYYINTTAPKHTGEIANLLDAHNPPLSWAAYMQSMPGPCSHHNTSAYKAAHNPFVWYTDLWYNQSDCRAHDLGFGAFAQAVSTSNGSQLPVYGFFSPNSTNDCWLSGLAACDPWLKGWLSPLINDSFFSSTAFVITYDEAASTDLRGVNNTTGGGRIYTSVVSPYACPGFKSYVNYTHYNLLTTSEWILGLGRIGLHDNWTQYPPMKDMFCFPSNTTGGSPGGRPSPAASAISGVTSPAVAVRRSSNESQAAVGAENAFRPARMARPGTTGSGSGSERDAD